MESFRCQGEPAISDGAAPAEAERSMVFEELANHFGLMSNVLRPVCDNHELEFTSCERRIVGQLLKEMSDLINELQAHRAANRHC
jgi:hypothetical protein